MKHICLMVLILIATGSVIAEDVPRKQVEGQPLGANIGRVIQTFDYLGFPLPEATVKDLRQAIKDRASIRMQKLLDEHALFVVSLNPEFRVKVRRGPAKANLQQGGFTPLLVKVLNDSTVTRQLKINSPQSGPVYSGASLGILKRQAQTELNKDENTKGDTNRFLSVALHQSPPLTPNLSGLQIEYAVALIYSHESGKREATIGFDVGADTQDIGFRGEVPVLFDVQPAIPVKLRVLDDDGKPTVARFTFRDEAGRVYPPQAKRLAPDFFFQSHIYRGDGDVVLLPPGQFHMETTRGPEYRVRSRKVQVPSKGPHQIGVQVDRWVSPMKHGFYSGDHHIHGAGCSHYQSPTEGVTPQDMFRQVKGEGLNVGCVLTWGPCFDFQRRYFSPKADVISEPLTILKYDLEISGFGSAALGHVCLLNLKNQTYPGSEGTKVKGWPTWTVPVLRWTKEQGGVTGYPHSAMHVNPTSAAQHMRRDYDKDKNGTLSADEAGAALLPDSFDAIDVDKDGSLTERELLQSIDRAADRLPNLAIPSMNGGGAMEICVSTAEGVCDFISAMDTARIPEWNTWYHIMNCGFPLKLSGETDFPCMSSRRVGQGRVYVQLGDIEKVDFTKWCEGVAKGRSYVSDGFAHALDFHVNNARPGFEDINLKKSGYVNVTAEVSFAPEIPRAVAYGMLTPSAGKRMVGDTINLHAPRATQMVKGGKRSVEIVMNGEVVARMAVEADGKPHRFQMEIPVEKSSWIALRQFPQLHTNPVIVKVDNKPIRASRKSARWCAETIKLLWKNRHMKIAESERDAALASYQKAIKKYEQIAEESE
ncbi:MAG: hypothetical protein CMJ78_12655 [Planctomycetaceae bacterium]|nr:hypothetical protein [Planctomycetaceae bacterium]